MSHYLEQIDSDLEFFDTNHHLPEAQALTERYPRAWVLAAGYWRTPDYQAWMESLQPVLRRPLGNIQLYFSPDFRALFSQPDRGPGLLPLLNDLGESPHRQEFADSRFLLGAGWAGPEKTQKGRTFRWAVASRAEIALVTPPGEAPKTLDLRLMPFPRPVGEPQTIQLSIDDEPWTSITLGPRWNKIDLPWPKAPGTVHLLSFDFGWNQRPKDLDPNATDDRPLAAAFDFVEIVDAEEGVSDTAGAPNP